MSFHIIDRETHRFVADLETQDEAKRRLAELLEANPDADLFIFSAGDDEDPSGSLLPFPSVVAEPEPQLLDEIGRVRDTE